MRDEDKTRRKVSECEYHPSIDMEGIWQVVFVCVCVCECV